MAAKHAWWRHPAVWIALFAVVTTLAFLNTRGLWDPDEGRYSNVAMTMLDRGEWLVPHRNAEVAHWTKPPLTYWAIASSLAVFGIDAGPARVPSALSHLLCVLLVGLMGRRLMPGGGARAAIAYAAMLFPFGAAQFVSTDAPLAAMETLALWGFVEARFGASHPKRWLALMWAAFGLAFLTKGPPGLLPLLPIVLFDLLTRRPGRPALLRPLGLLLFVAIAAPWYLAVTSMTPGLMRHFLGSEVVGRVASDEFKRHGEWYGWAAMYVPTLLLGTLPWSPTLWRWLRGLPAQLRAWRGGAAARIADAPWLLCTLWLIAPLIVFCVSRSRLPLYILPLFAPIALLVALQWTRDARPLPTWRFLLPWALLMIAMKVGAAFYPALLVQHKPGSTMKDARIWAREIRARTDAPISEVLFVEDAVRYGLHVHLGRGVQIEKLSLMPVADARFNPEYDGAVSTHLRRNEAARLWVCRVADFDRIAAFMRSQGVIATPLGTPWQGRVFFRATPVTPGGAPPAH